MQQHEYGPGLEGVIAGETYLSHVDGEAGELVIGGFAIDELAPRATYEEVLYLLWHRALPDERTLSDLRLQLAAHRALPRQTFELLKAAVGRRVHPMDALRMGAASLSLADPDPREESRAADERRAILLVATLPTLAATFWRLQSGLSPVEPSPELGHAANYLYMLTGELPAASAVRAVETYLNTVIDHGMNASTFTARVIASTHSDMVSAVVGAIGALKGPLHGGAPGPALDMVFDIRARADRSGRPLEDEARDWVRETVASGGRIMGFGHRVYKVRDPRADVLNLAAAELVATGGDRRLYDDARAVENIVLEMLEELKPGRRLQTNVEFYTALVLHGIGFEADLFTPTFAIGRVGGWTAHVFEQLAEGRLIRPQVAYIGARDRAFVPVEGRH